MGRILINAIAVGAVIAAVTAGSEPASAQNARWCTQSRSGILDCAWNTFEQCHASASGIGAFCVQNPRWVPRKR